MAETEVAIDHSLATSEDGPGADNPGAESLSVQAERPALQRYLDVYAGTDEVTSPTKRQVYLPQFEREADAAYNIRASKAVLFPATRKTATSFTGMVYRKPLEIGDDVPDQARDDLENIDLAGRHINQFGQDVFEDSIAGHSCILVDWSGPEGATNQREEEASGARPYWIEIRKEQIVRVRSVNIGGHAVLVRFAYRETETVEDGKYTEKQIERVRQLDLVETDGQSRVQFQSWQRECDSAGEWIPEQEEPKLLGPRMTEIPVATSYGNRTGFMRSDPVPNDLVRLNIRHMQVASDADTGLEATLHDVFVTWGIDPDEIATFAMGPSNGLALPNAPGEQDAEFRSAAGNGLSHAETRLERLENQMAAAGASVLLPRDRTQRTATESENEKLEQDSDLARMARSHEDALEEALRFHAMWLGLGDDAGGSVEVNKAFVSEKMTPERITALAALVPEKLSLGTFLGLLVRGEALPDTLEVEQEIARISASGQAEMRAVLEALRRARTTEGDGGDEPSGEDPNEGGDDS